MPTTMQRIISITAEQMGVLSETVTEGTRFVEDLGADSLDSIELLMALEYEFGIEIPDEEAERVATPADALAWLVKHHPTKAEA